MNDILKKFGPLGLAVLVLAAVVYWQMKFIDKMADMARDERSTQALNIMNAIGENCKPKEIKNGREH